MDIVVMDRTKARAESFRKHAPATAIISIADVIMENNGFHRSNWLKSVLYLHFNDVQAGMPFCITAKDAKAIRDFVMAVSPHVERLIVHCVAGISRSAGVAAAIDQALTAIIRTFPASGLCAKPSNKAIKPNQALFGPADRSAGLLYSASWVLCYTVTGLVVY
jgi:predicted protein tyrosine phosphatase